MKTVSKARACKRKSFLAVIVSLLICLFTYLSDCCPFQLLGSLDLFSYIAPVIGNNKPFPTDVMLVNTATDLELVEIDGGNAVISDRSQLARFLQIADSVRNYKHVFFDILLPEGYQSPNDSALVSVLSRLPRLTMAKSRDIHGVDVPLSYSEQLESRRFYNDYGYTVTNANFTRYQLIQNDESSVALHMYGDIGTSKDKVTKFGPFFFSHGLLCQGSPIITLSEKFCSTDHNGRDRFTRVMLGDYLKENSNDLVSEMEDKIILISNFSTDVHTTYLGPVPGALWTYASYNYLTKGKHIIYPWKFISLFLLYFLLCLGILCNTGNKVIERYFKGKLGLLISSLVGFGIILTTVSVIIYCLHGIILTTFIPSVILSLVCTFTKSDIIHYPNES